MNLKIDNPLTSNQRANLSLVRDILTRKIESNEPEYWLDSFVQECGAHGCVLGDYILAKKGITEVDVDPEGGTFVDRELDTMCHVLYWQNLARVREFGHRLSYVIKTEGSPNTLVDVFGSSTEGSLQERLDLVNEVLNYEI